MSATQYSSKSCHSRAWAQIMACLPVAVFVTAMEFSLATLSIEMKAFVRILASCKKSIVFFFHESNKASSWPSHQCHSHGTSKLSPLYASSTSDPFNIVLICILMSASSSGDFSRANTRLKQKERTTRSRRVSYRDNATTVMSQACRSRPVVSMSKQHTATICGHNKNATP